MKPIYEIHRYGKWFSFTRSDNTNKCWDAFIDRHIRIGGTIKSRGKFITEAKEMGYEAKWIIYKSNE